MSTPHRSAPRRSVLSPMVARRGDEGHRASTPLELLFDLCFVVAIAFAAASLHHHVVDGHAVSGMFSYLMVFFAIWWAWMNFTWFASSYDNDDPIYRLFTLVQIAGALVLAAGVGPATDDYDFTIITIGYVVMRVAMVAQWLRAARSDPERRATALRYAGGIVIVQVLWVARLFLPDSVGIAAFLVVALLDMAVPVLAERRANTTWHAGHIAERYGLFTIIVLGESILAATTAMSDAFSGDGEHLGLLGLAAVSLVIMFAMWWLYFDQHAEDLLTSFPVAVRWGYAHYFLFAAVAAVGAGIEVAIEYDISHAENAEIELSSLTAGYAIALPVAVFLVLVWFLHILPRPRTVLTAAYPAAAVLVLLTPFTGAPVHIIAAIMAAMVAVTVFLPAREAARSEA